MLFRRLAVWTAVQTAKRLNSCLGCLMCKKLFRRDTVCSVVQTVSHLKVFLQASSEQYTFYNSATRTLAHQHTGRLKRWDTGTVRPNLSLLWCLQALEKFRPVLGFSFKLSWTLFWISIAARLNCVIFFSHLPFPVQSEVQGVFFLASWTKVEAARFPASFAVYTAYFTPQKIKILVKWYGFPDCGALIVL